MVNIQTLSDLSNCDIRPATLGNSIVDVSRFKEPYYFHDLGLKHTSFCKSAICYIDGEQGLLLLRGYPIEQLAEHYDFVSVIYLLLYGELPTHDQQLQLQNNLREQQIIPEYLDEILQSLPHDMHPMGVLLTLVSSLSADENNLQNDQATTAIRIIAQMPVLVAMVQRHQQNLAPVPPRSDLDYVANFLYMLNGQIPDQLSVDVFQTIFTLHSEHEQNASTCTMRVTSSTGTNAYASVAAAIVALWGPLHGGANEACMNMLTEIADIERIPAYLEKAKSKTDPFRLMGFGHRVYKNKDPRSSIMKTLCDRVLDKNADHKLLQLAKCLEKQALDDPYFISHKLYANCDYYSGILQSTLGIPTSCFTTIFTLARTTGWMSHWLELQGEPGSPIIRPRQHYVGPKKRDIPAQAAK